MRLKRLIERIRKDGQINEAFWAYVFVAPNLLLFLVFLFIPIINTVLLSFQRFSFRGANTWVGLENYQRVLANPTWWDAVRVSAIYALCVIPISVLLAFIIAVLILNYSSFWQTVFKSMFYLPTVVSGIVVSLVWLWIYYPTEAGLANYFLSLLGIEPIIWLGSVKWALPSLILMGILSGFGSGVILYCASIGGLPQNLIDAAEIDAASWFTKIRKIVWPLVKPVTLYLLVIGLAQSFQVFTQPYVMTNGGPLRSTTTVVFYIYTQAFEYFQFGPAAAMSVLLAVIVFIFSYISYRYFSSDVEY